IKRKDYEDMNEKASTIVKDAIKTKDHPVLGLATGSTPEGLYERLIQTYKAGQVSFEKVTTFNLDEYIGLSPEDENSYHYYMKEKFFKHIDLPIEQSNVPKGDTSDVGQAGEDSDRLIVDIRHGT